MQRKLARWAGPALGLLLILAALWLIFAVYTAGHPLIAVLFLVILGASTWLLSIPNCTRGAIYIRASLPPCYLWCFRRRIR